MKKKFYITTAIAYVNAQPHIGHALEFCQGDVLARYARQMGKDVYFLTGTDEHGSKIEQTAKEEGITPLELADKNSAKVLALAEALNLSHDQFIRTTSDLHEKGAQKIWKMIEEKGFFYEKEYEGLYCVGCEAFVLEKDLVDGLCPHHQKKPELLKEKNIFFKLSEFTDAIKKKVESGELLIRPESRRNEFLSFLKEGLQDVSFSRPKKTLAWGIEVPSHPNQVMYVWCDALSNYLTALGFATDDKKVEQYWPADVHLIGKDIIRFHCAYWIAMLMAAELPIPKSIYVHGFVTSEGKKMSKSLGNVVDPMALIEEWGMDPVRYYLLREIPTGDDGDFSRNRFEILYREELANTIGNLVRRVVAMTEKYVDAKVPQGDGSLHKDLEKAEARFHESMEIFNIRAAVEAVLEIANAGNAYVENTKPWAMAKDNPDALPVVLGNLIELCRKMGSLLESILPETSAKILAQVGEKKVKQGEPLFPIIQKE